MQVLPAGVTISGFVTCTAKLVWRDEIIIPEEFEEGTVREVEMHDGSSIVLKKLEHDYDPTSKYQALQKLEEAQQNNWLITGLIYLDTSKPALNEKYQLVGTALNRLTEKELRPGPETIQQINDLMF